jgi:hypothetical protein
LRVRAAAHGLAVEGYILDEDVETVTADGAARYDEALRER